MALLKFKTLLGAVLLALVVSGCNTTAGVGRDLEAAGDAIADEAEEHKDY